MTKAEQAPASMTKEAAAEFLGISVRTLQRLTAAAKVAVKYTRTDHGDQAEYDRGELERFKLRQPMTSYVRPAVTGDTPVTPGGAETTALAPVQPNYVEHLAAALDALKNALRPAAPPVALSEKLMLTLAEAAALSGLSRRILLAAIKAKKLKAQILGRGWKIKRADLEAWVQKL